MSFGEVQDFLSESLIVGPIIEGAGWETLGMSLQRVRLLNLTSMGQAHVLYAKDVGGIVAISRDLTWP